jgi:hypothetical protein
VDGPETVARHTAGVRSASGQHVFVVRTWLESPGDLRTMRGSIDHIASGRRRYFSNYGELCDFVTAAQSLQPAPSSNHGAGECDDVPAS